MRVDDDALRLAELGGNDVRRLARNAGQPKRAPRGAVAPARRTPRSASASCRGSPSPSAGRSRSRRCRARAPPVGRRDSPRAAVLLEQRGRDAVHVHVRRLRGEHHRDQQLDVRAEAQRDAGVRVLDPKPRDHRADAGLLRADAATCLGTKLRAMPGGLLASQADDLDERLHEQSRADDPQDDRDRSRAVLREPGAQPVEAGDRSGRETQRGRRSARSGPRSRQARRTRGRPPSPPGHIGPADLERGRDDEEAVDPDRAEDECDQRAHAVELSDPAGLRDDGDPRPGAAATSHGRTGGARRRSRAGRRSGARSPTVRARRPPRPRRTRSPRPAGGSP